MITQHALHLCCGAFPKGPLPASGAISILIRTGLCGNEADPLLLYTALLPFVPFAFFALPTPHAPLSASVSFQNLFPDAERPSATVYLNPCDFFSSPSLIIFSGLSLRRRGWQTYSFSFPCEFWFFFLLFLDSLLADSFYLGHAGVGYLFLFR